MQQVHLGEHGTLQANQAGDFDRFHHLLTRDGGMLEHATAHGAMALDAPVSGGDVGAREGRLSIMVGGPEAAFQSAQPLFEHLGKTIVHHGDPGAGQRAKLVNQILVAGGMLGLAEAMAFCEQSGLNHERVLQSVSAGAAGSWAVDHLAPRVARGDFDPGFFVAHLKKDLGLVLEAGADLGLPLPAIQWPSRPTRLSENGMGTLGTGTRRGRFWHWVRSQDFLHNTLESDRGTRNTARVGIQVDPLVFLDGTGGLKMDAIRVEIVNSDHTEAELQDLVLIEREGDVIHMCIGLFEAAAIRRRQRAGLRPQTHDLLDNTIAALDARPHHVLIRHEDNGVFFADLVLERRSEHVVVDARPADALALCCRLDLPIYADAEMLERLEIERRLLAAPIT